MTAVALATTERVTGSGVSTVLRVTRLDATLQELVARGSQAPQRVIIRVKPGKRAALRQSLIAHGDQVLFDHASIDAITAVVHGLDLGAGRRGPDVVDRGRFRRATHGSSRKPHDQPDERDRSLLKTVAQVILPGGGDTSGPAVPPSVLRNTLGVGDSRWTGRGVGIAVIDSGLEMSAEFQGRVTAFYDMTGGRTVATSPFDDYGHGTHVAGAIGGSGALSRWYDYRGLAPNVRLIVLKALDKTGAGYTSDVIRAIDFAVENRARFGSR